MTVAVTADDATADMVTNNNIEIGEDHDNDAATALTRRSSISSSNRAIPKHSDDSSRRTIEIDVVVEHGGGASKSHTSSGKKKTFMKGLRGSIKKIRKVFNGLKVVVPKKRSGKATSDDKNGTKLNHNTIIRTTESQTAEADATVVPARSVKKQKKKAMKKRRGKRVIDANDEDRDGRSAAATAAGVIMMPDDNVEEWENMDDVNSIPIESPALVKAKQKEASKHKGSKLKGWSVFKKSSKSAGTAAVKKTKNKNRKQTMKKTVKKTKAKQRPRRSTMLKKSSSPDNDNPRQQRRQQRRKPILHVTIASDAAAGAAAAPGIATTPLLMGGADDGLSDTELGGGISTQLQTPVEISPTASDGERRRQRRRKRSSLSSLGQGSRANSSRSSSSNSRWSRPQKLFSFMRDQLLKSLQRDPNARRKRDRKRRRRQRRREREEKRRLEEELERIETPTMPSTPLSLQLSLPGDAQNSGSSSLPMPWSNAKKTTTNIVAGSLKKEMELLRHSTPLTDHRSVHGNSNNVEMTVSMNNLAPTA